MRDLTIAFSPDADDAFMFYALTQDKLDPGDLALRFHPTDIETLNRKSLEGAFEVTAASFHAYAYMAGKYAVLDAGGSFGDRYGPILVSREPFPRDTFKKLQVAIPGTMTTAFLALRLLEPDIAFTLTPFDRILDAVEAGEADAGLVIHEAQLTYGERGLHKLLDLGEWWHEETGLPLPLGGLFVRRDLGGKTAGRVAGLVRSSIEYALAHAAEAEAHALAYGRGMDGPVAGRFIRMYVNERSLRYGREERAALEALFARAHEQGILPHAVPVDIAG
ncbi:MAG TPA: MqnA/MqnD/SBP family protein [Candidatus Methylomirabilis sp.]|jgi:1,4-dihydroxy-6-naphthoate synthase